MCGLSSVLGPVCHPSAPVCHPSVSKYDVVKQSRCQDSHHICLDKEAETLKAMMSHGRALSRRMNNKICTSVNNHCDDGKWTTEATL